MVVETVNSTYEVHEGERRFRRAGGSASWKRYDRIGPVREGEPLTFFIVKQEAGRALRYQVVTTSPVTQVRAA